MKACSKCKVEKELCFFYKSSRNKSGYRAECIECEKKYKEENKERLREYNKNRIYDKESKIEYYQKNKESILEKRKENYSLNRDSKLGYQKEYGKNNNGYSKNSKTEELLGCSFEEFKTYLESKFEDWMTWDNRGLYNGELYYGWDIDHITPLSSVDNENDIIRLNHYTNLQPLCSKVNRDINRDKLDYYKK